MSLTAATSPSCCTCRSRPCSNTPGAGSSLGASSAGAGSSCATRWRRRCGRLRSEHRATIGRQGLEGSALGGPLFSSGRVGAKRPALRRGAPFGQPLRGLRSLGTGSPSSRTRGGTSSASATISSVSTPGSHCPRSNTPISLRCKEAISASRSCARLRCSRRPRRFSPNTLSARPRSAA
jgi:hypothetical protein